MDIKIRGASKEQWSVAADMVRANVGTIERLGVANGMGLIRGDIKAYLYITASGKCAVMDVETIDHNSEADRD